MFMLTLQNIKNMEQWIGQFPEGVSLTKLLKKYGVPCTNRNKLIFISMLKYQSTLRIGYRNTEIMIIYFPNDIR